MDLSTTYLGLQLANPIIPGASPLTDDLDTVKRLEEAGAPAIIMRSLFEEQITNEQFRDEQDVEAAEDTWYEALTYFPRRDEYRMAGVDTYLEQLRRVKEAVSVPVIGSLNGATPGGWTQFGRYLEEAGADALELNLYFLSTDLHEGCGSVEERVIQIARSVKESVKVPVAVKLGQFFSSFPNLVQQLEQVGVDGVVFFNRFYQPDIDVEELEVVPRLRLSDSSELSLRLRFLAILSGKTNLSLSCTGGCHSGHDALKAIMCGAHTVQMVSSLLRKGPGHLAVVRQDLERWLEEHEYESLAQAHGSMSLEHSPDPAAFERGNYIRIIQGGVKYV